MSGIDSFTKLLLHCDGANNSTTFTDSSASAATVTANGNAKITTAQNKFGGASGVFDGTGDFLRPPSSTDFAMSTGAFTIDCWLRLNATGAYQFIWSPTPGSNSGLSVDQSTNRLGYNTPGGVNTIVGTTALTTGTWYHVALTRSGSSNRLFLNGTQEGSTATDSTDYGTTAVQPYIGIFQDGATLALNGWLDEFRVSKGIARWTANFTPPTSAYSVDSAEVGIQRSWEFAPGSGPTKHLHPTQAYPRLPYAYVLTATVGTYALSGVAAATTRQSTFTAVAGAYTLSGVAAAFPRALKVSVTTGVYVLSGVAAALNKGKSLVAAAGAYVLSGVPAVFPAARKVTAVTGTYALTGVAAALNKGKLIVATAGAYVLSGVAAAFPVTRKVTAVTGVYTLSGVAATFPRALKVTAVAGAYVLSGVAATLSHGYKSVFAAGAYVLSGKAITAPLTRIVSVTTGVYTLSGVAAVLNKGKFLVAVAGSYVLTGKAITFPRSLILTAVTGVYTLTGVATELVYRLFEASQYLKRRAVAPALQSLRTNLPVLYDRGVKPTLQLIRDVTPSLTLRRSVSPKLNKIRDVDPSLGD